MTEKVWNKIHSYELSLDNDVYCMAFRAFLTVSNQKILSEITMKAFVTFMFQASLMGILNLDFMNTDAESILK